MHDALPDLITRSDPWLYQGLPAKPLKSEMITLTCSSLFYESGSGAMKRIHSCRMAVNQHILYLISPLPAIFACSPNVALIAAHREPASDTVTQRENNHLSFANIRIVGEQIVRSKLETSGKTKRSEYPELCTFKLQQQNVPTPTPRAKS